MKTGLFMPVVLAITLAGCKDDQKEAGLASGEQVVEFAPFKLKKNVSEQSLLEASEALQKEFVEKQDGFVRRELVKKSEREYVDILYWRNRGVAEKAVQNAMNSPVCLAYFQLMEDMDHNDPAGGVTHYEIVTTYR